MTTLDNTAIATPSEFKTVEVSKCTISIDNWGEGDFASYYLGGDQALQVKIPEDVEDKSQWTIDFFNRALEAAGATSTI